jgi:hypothetical protein
VQTEDSCDSVEEVELMAWNDERLDELSGRVDRGFARVDGEIRDLRTEMRGEFKDVRTEMQRGFAQVRVEIEGMRQMMFRLCLVMIVSLASLIVTLIGAIAAGAL